MPNREENSENLPPRAIVLRLPRLSRRRLTIATIGLICAVIIAVGTIWYLRENTAAIGIPRNVRAGIQFPLYYPRHLSPEFKVESNSFAASSGVLTYSYVYKNHTHIVINTQAISDAISTTDFHPTDSFQTSIGKAYIADIADTRTTAAVTTDKSFILINAPGQIPMDAMKEFINSLSPAR